MITTLRYIRKQTIFFFLCILPTNSPIQLPLCCKRFTHSSKTRIAKIHAVRHICFFARYKNEAFVMAWKISVQSKWPNNARREMIIMNLLDSLVAMWIWLLLSASAKGFQKFRVGLGERLLLWFTDQHQFPIPGCRGLRPCPAVSPASRAAAPCDG